MQNKVLNRDKDARRRKLFTILATVVVGLVLLLLTGMKSTGSHDIRDTFSINSTDMLKAYVIFTGMQILVINQNEFDWTNIEMRVAFGSAGDAPPCQTTGAEVVALTISRIRSGEAYTIEVADVTRQAERKLVAVFRWPKSIKLWSETPHGRGHWFGFRPVTAIDATGTRPPMGESCAAAAPQIRWQLSAGLRA